MPVCPGAVDTPCHSYAYLVWCLATVQTLCKLWTCAPFSAKPLACKEITPSQASKTTGADLSYRMAHGQTLQSKPERVAKWVGISEQSLNLSLDMPQKR